MRAHDHDVDGGRSLRPKANRIESDDADLMYRAATGRTEALGPAGLLAFVQRVEGEQEEEAPT